MTAGATYILGAGTATPTSRLWEARTLVRVSFACAPVQHRSTWTHTGKSFKILEFLTRIWGRRLPPFFQTVFWSVAARMATFTCSIRPR